MTYAVQPPPITALPVAETDETFPVTRVYCVGRNYAEHAVELGEGGADLTASAALSHVVGYAVGLDMTRRDMQAEAKKAGRPWDMAKGFDQSAPTGAIRPAEEVGHPQRGAV